MASVRYLTRMLQRIKEGEACSTRDWDNKVVPKSVKKILKKYELAGTYNPKMFRFCAWEEDGGIYPWMSLPQYWR